MASFVPESGSIKTFRTQAAFESRMRKNHASEREVWLRIYKKDSAVPSITIAEALDVVLCWGWIDGIRKPFDERSYLWRYTPRRAKRFWSQINREHVARLTKIGRMTPHGQRHVNASKVDGRWDWAYAPIRGALDEHFPNDLREAIEASPRARKDVSVSRAAESLCARVSHHQHEDTGRTGEKNRCTDRDVETRRHALPRASLMQLALAVRRADDACQRFRDA